MAKFQLANSMGSSNMAPKMNNGTSKVAEFIARGPITAKGEILKGLIARRAEEAQLYLK